MPVNQNQSVATCAIERGISTLTYVKGGNGAAWGSAQVRVPDEHAGHITIISAPGRQDAELASPGACLVIVAEAPGSLELLLTVPPDSTAADANFRLEILDRGLPPSSIAVRSPLSGAASSAREQLEPAIDGLDISILAHVSRIGDVRLGSGEWVAGPQSPLPIEGLSFTCSFGTMGIECQFRSAAFGGAWSDWLPPETFAGTRQRAKALTGVRLRLTGPDVARFVLMGDALFLGAPIMSKVGDTVEFAGPSDSDPMVGFRLKVAPRGPSDDGTRVSSSASKVRVFRASGFGQRAQF